MFTRGIGTHPSFPKTHAMRFLDEQTPLTKKQWKIEGCQVDNQQHVQDCSKMGPGEEDMAGIYSRPCLFFDQSYSKPVFISLIVEHYT